MSYVAQGLFSARLKEMIEAQKKINKAKTESAVAKAQTQATADVLAAQQATNQLLVGATGGGGGGLPILPIVAGVAGLGLVLVLTLRKKS
jgi:hypothetical protein